MYTEQSDSNPRLINSSLATTLTPAEPQPQVTRYHLPAPQANPYIVLPYRPRAAAGGSVVSPY